MSKWLPSRSINRPSTLFPRNSSPPLRSPSPSQGPLWLTQSLTPHLPPRVIDRSPHSLTLAWDPPVQKGGAIPLQYSIEVGAHTALVLFPDLVSLYVPQVIYAENFEFHSCAINDLIWGRTLLNISNSKFSSYFVLLICPRPWYSHIFGFVRYFSNHSSVFIVFQNINLQPLFGRKRCLMQFRFCLLSRRQGFPETWQGMASESLKIRAGCVGRSAGHSAQSKINVIIGVAWIFVSCCKLRARAFTPNFQVYYNTNTLTIYSNLAVHIFESYGAAL